MKPDIKSIPYDEFNDNETLEELKRSRSPVIVSTLDNIINWGRSNSVWPLTFATSCCGIEMMATFMSKYDAALEEVVSKGFVLKEDAAAMRATAAAWAQRLV